MHPDVADYIGCYRMLKRCLDVDPCNVEALCTFAVFLSDYLGERDEALNTYEKVLSLDTDNLIALTGKASLIAESCAGHGRGDVDRVKRMYEEILDLHPESVEALIGSACFEKQVLCSPENAKSLFTRALAQDPSNVQVLFNLGSIAHFDEGDLEGALQVEKSFLDCVENDVWSYIDICRGEVSRTHFEEPEKTCACIVRCTSGLSQ